jgi:cytochrome c553
LKNQLFPARSFDKLRQAVNRSKDALSELTVSTPNATIGAQLKSLSRLSSVVTLLVASAALPVLAATLEERLAACLACHGQKGQSTLPEVPSLGAQPAFYLSVQLYMFRERMRSNEQMNAMMKGLSDDELRRMAAISKLPPPQPAGETQILPD